MVIKLREHVGADDPGERLDEAFALVAAGKLDQVGNVGGMQRLDELAGSLVVALVDSVEHAFDELGPKPVLLVHHRMISGFDVGNSGGCAAKSSRSRSSTRPL